MIVGSVIYPISSPGTSRWSWTRIFTGFRTYTMTTKTCKYCWPTPSRSTRTRDRTSLKVPRNLLHVSNQCPELKMRFLRAPVELDDKKRDLGFSAKVHFPVLRISKNISGARRKLILKMRVCELSVPPCRHKENIR